MLRYMILIRTSLVNALKYIVDTNALTLIELEEYSLIKSRYWEKIIDAVKDKNTKSMNNLCHYIVNGKRIIGKTNIERLFIFLAKYDKGLFPQVNNLF